MSEPVHGGRGGSPSPLVVRTKSDLDAAVQHVSQFDTFVVDVETTIAHPKVNTVLWVGLAVPDRVVLIPMGHPLGRLISPATSEMVLPPEEERPVLKDGSLSKRKVRRTVPPVFGDPGKQLRPDVVFEALRPLLFSDRTKVGHNIKFDLESIAKYYGAVPPGPYVDTVILTHVLDENLPRFGLKDLVMDWLRVPPNPKVRAEFYPNLGKRGVHEQPFDEVARYLAKDVWYTLLYYRRHLPLVLGQPDLSHTFDMEMSLYPVLLDMELTGIRIDTAALMEKGDQLRSERKYLEHQVWTLCGEQFPLSNPTDKRRWLFGTKASGGQGLKPLSYTEKKQEPRLDQATLEHYAPTNDLARYMLEWSEKDKVIGTFIDGLSSKLVDDRLHTSFKQHGTVTGRLSSANPNLQQIPRGDMIRETFVADSGCLLVVADYDQVELRCAAYLSQDPSMIEVFQKNRDIHSQAASAMLGVPLEDVTPEQRQVGKTQNFGTLYGAGPGKIAQVANCSLEQAEQFIDRYFQEFSGLAAWKVDMIMRARKTGRRDDAGKIPYASIPPFGRRRRLPGLFSSDLKERSRAERQVINSIVQGFAANIMKLAMIDLHRRVQGLPYQILLNVHDELVVQAPEESVEDARRLVVECMESVTYNGVPVLGPVPLTADGGIGKSWAEAK